MSDEHSVPAIAEEQAREIINRWSQDGLFRLRNMGDKIFISEIVGNAAFTLRVETHLERRKVRTVTDPYHGGLVDASGYPPAPWDISVQQPKPFQEKTETVTIPHTDRVLMCHACSGAGQVTCSTCGGQGRTICMQCSGRGFLDHPVQGAQGDGQAVQTIRRGCTCMGGQVICQACGGQQFVRCSSCAGSGHLKEYDQVVVQFANTRKSAVLDVTPVPDNWLAHQGGEVLCDLTDPFLERYDEGTPRVVAKANELLAESHAIDDTCERVLMQSLTIERIPVQEIRYKYAGVDHQMWICGTKNTIHAPSAPWNRQRFFAILGSVVLGIALVLALLFFLVFR